MNSMVLSPKCHKFVILGSARTGSNLLSSLLSSHPQIKTYGELFNLDTLPNETLLEAVENPIGYLQKRMDKVHGAEITAVGFKMFYDHLTSDYVQKPVCVLDAARPLQENFARFAAFLEKYDHAELYSRFHALWELLYADRCLSVIHLKRSNMLHTLISLKLAFATKRWWRLDTTQQEEKRVTVHLDPEECSRYFTWLESRLAEADAAFAGHPTIEVKYEDLASDQQHTLRRIFQFLDVPDVAVTSRMRKQNEAPAWQVVENYDQLKESFCGSRWSALFD